MSWRSRESRRYDLYDLFIDKPLPLVSRSSIFEVTERMAYDGSIRISLDEEESRKVIRTLAGLGAESIGICLLHSYVNLISRKIITMPC